jgi:cytochrome c peroxidase
MACLGYASFLDATILIIIFTHLILPNIYPWKHSTLWSSQNFNMRKSFLAALAITGTLALVSIAFTKSPDKRSTATRTIASLYKTDMLRLDSFLAAYPKYFYDSSHALRMQKYQELSFHLKRVEAFFTYLHPKEAIGSFFKTAQFEPHENDFPFPDNWLIAGPFGNEPDSVLKKWKARDTAGSLQFIIRGVKNFRKVIAQTNLDADVAAITDQDIFEALRLQMARISTIGLANGDFVIADAGLPGLRGEFSAWAQMMRIVTEQLPAGQAALRRSVMQKLEATALLLQKQQDFAAFNRMHFLTTYLIPLAHDLKKVRTALNIQPKKIFSAFNPNVASIYDNNAFNADFFAPGEEARFSQAKAELGKLLFFDPILSGNNERACASCHKPERAFTDGHRRSFNFTRGDLPRNAPTVINAAFQKSQFWDLRTGTLEDQLDSVINSPDELHSNFEEVIDKLNASKEYIKLFNTAFPETIKGGIQRKHVKIAIATYERMLTGLNSRFDQYVRGDKGKLTEAEIEGFNVYMGKAKCGACHYAPLFAGALPPYFEFTDHRSIGVPMEDSMEVYKVDVDTGASKVFKSVFTHFSFKVPTVRNVELTAPYMHNGVYKTLEQVVDFYDHAGGVKFTNQMRPGMKGLPFFMILPEQLNLTAKEKASLIAFMKALTDNSAAVHVPKRLPEISGKYAELNVRDIGGIY